MIINFKLIFQFSSGMERIYLFTVDVSLGSDMIFHEDRFFPF